MTKHNYISITSNDLIEHTKNYTTEKKRALQDKLLAIHNNYLEMQGMLAELDENYDTLDIDKNFVLYNEDNAVILFRAISHFERHLIETKEVAPNNSRCYINPESLVK